VRLLVTRPQPDAERTAAALRARGHAVAIAPLLATESIDFELPDALPGAVVLTSANAARSVARHSRRALLTALPAFTVGAHTAEAARAAGFHDVHAADGDRLDLMRMLGERFGAGSRPLLYLSGEHRSGELTGCAAPVVTVVVYRAHAADRFPPPVERALSENWIDGVLHLSRRTVETYLDCAVRAGLLARALQPRHFCLSRQVAGPLVAAGAAGIRVASLPQETTLIDLVGT
jgi:uroporphyrinogen-III synthase